MNEIEYKEAKRALIDSVRQRDFESANAIRLLILNFYKPRT